MVLSYLEEMEASEIGEITGLAPIPARDQALMGAVMLLVRAVFGLAAKLNRHGARRLQSKSDEGKGLER